MQVTCRSLSSLPFVKAAWDFMYLWLRLPNAVLHQLAEPDRRMACLKRRMMQIFAHTLSGMLA